MASKITDSGREKIARELEKKAIKVVRESKNLAPVDTGRLRSSITYEMIDLPGQLPKALVGTNVEYACVTGRTRITTRDGYELASSIEKGTEVLTQAGKYKPIKNKYKYKVPLGDELVEIKSKWRKDKDHSITVTPDHEILVYRNGRNKWIEARNLEKGDKVYHKIKKPHNKGSTNKIRNCENCGKKYSPNPPKDLDIKKGQGNKFCSQECRNEYWYEKGNNPHIGMERSEKSKEKMSKTRKELIKNNPKHHPNKLAAESNTTERENDVAEFLDKLDIEYEREKYIDGYWVDFYCPNEKLIVEADGAYWHQDQQEDIERDKDILNNLDKDWEIEHIHFYSKRHSPNLEEKPIENVKYVSVNPGTKTYLDNETFEKTEIIEINTREVSRDSKRAKKYKPVYDFEVEGIHSYYANGFVVSNSFVEFGTENMPAQPFLRPALNRLKAGQL